MARLSGTAEAVPFQTYLLHSGEGLRDFLDIGDDGNVVVFVPGEFAVTVDDGDGASGNAFVFQIDAVLGGDSAARLKVGKQRIVDAHFIGVGLVGPGAVDAEAHNLRVELFELFHPIAGADWR